VHFAAACLVVVGFFLFFRSSFSSAKIMPPVSFTVVLQEQLAAVYADDDVPMLFQYWYSYESDP